MTSRARWLTLMLALSGCRAAPVTAVAPPPAVATPAPAPRATSGEVDERHLHVVTADRDIDRPRCGGREETHAFGDLADLARWWTRRTWRNVLVEGEVELGLAIPVFPPRRTAVDR